MTTKNLINTFQKYFHVNSAWLERFFGVPHATFQRYLDGANEAKFNEVHQWLKQLSLELINDHLFFRTGSIIAKLPLESMPNAYIGAKFNAILDSHDWHSYGKAIEENEGHKVFWLKNAQFKPRGK